MPDITITLTDTQLKGLASVALSPEEWAQNAVTERARIAVDEIVGDATKRYLDEGLQIPPTREAIVEDAFQRGWVKTAAEIQAEFEAEQAASSNDVNGDGPKKKLFGMLNK